MDAQRDPLDQLLNASLGPEAPEDAWAPPRAMVATVRRVRLSNGHTMRVQIVRPTDAKPWSPEDEDALRAILDVAAAVANAPPDQLPS